MQAVFRKGTILPTALVGQGNRPFVPRIADEGEITRLAINYGIHDNLIE